MRDADYLIIAMLGAILITLVMATEAILRQTVPRVLWVPYPTGGGEPAAGPALDPGDDGQLELDIELARNVRRFRR
jgi:hypothetical protein